MVGSWVVLAGRHQISEHWSIPTVGILRHFEVFDRYEFAFFRTGATYTSKNKTDMTLGYAFLDSEAYIENDRASETTQHWLYGEVYLKPTANGIPLSHRYRWETRWFKRTEGNTLNNRVRYQLQWVQPLATHTYMKAFNEIFIGLQAPIFNQNRFYIGLGYTIDQNFKIEAGYLKNHFTSAHYDRLRIAIIFKTDISGKNRL